MRSIPRGRTVCLQWKLTLLVITQCSIRHLYTAEPRDHALIEQAKTYERRRCNHHTLDKPLSTLECLSSVVDSKGSLTNKHRYIIASQEAEVRAHMRQIPGVPAIYINRSVMIMEPMARSTEGLREQQERGKFRAGLKAKYPNGALGKRKREDVEETDGDEQLSDAPAPTEETAMPKQKRKKGPKGPNPLSVKKPKPKNATQATRQEVTDSATRPSEALREPTPQDGIPNGTSEPIAKKKRKRRHKSEKEAQDATGDVRERVATSPSLADGS